MDRDKDRDSSILLGNFNTGIEAAKIVRGGWRGCFLYLYICRQVLCEYYMGRVKYMDIWMGEGKKE